MYLDESRSSVDIALSCIVIAWEWVRSTEAGNLGSILSGIGTVLFLLLAFRWVSEKRAEKMSQIAENALNNLDVFLDQIKNWILFADSFIVYSKYSEANVAIQAALSEKEQKEFIEKLNNDKYEVNNYCKSGMEIVKILHKTVHHAKRLSDPIIDEKLKIVNEYARELPNQLFKAHHLPNPNASEKAREYIRNASNKIEVECLIIHDLLLNYLLFIRKRKTTA